MAEYEFTEKQNQACDRLARALRRFAIVVGVFAALLLILGISQMIGGAARPLATLGIIVAGGLSIVLAYLFLQPLDNFRNITATKGHDTTELLTALNDLNKAHKMFRLILFLFVLSTLVGLVTLMAR